MKARRLLINKVYGSGGDGLLLNVPLPAAQDTVLTFSGVVELHDTSNVSHSIAWRFFFLARVKGGAATVLGNGSISVAPIPSDVGASFGFDASSFDILTNTPGELKVFGSGPGSGLTVKWSGFLDLVMSNA